VEETVLHVEVYSICNRGASLLESMRFRWVSYAWFDRGITYTARYIVAVSCSEEGNPLCFGRANICITGATAVRNSVSGRSSYGDGIVWRRRIGVPHVDTYLGLKNGLDFRLVCYGHHCLLRGVHWAGNKAVL